MKALTYQGHRKMEIKNIPDPELQQPGDAVIRIERTAICGSDLHLYHAPDMGVTDFPMGHEFLGTIEELGKDVRGFRRGQVAVIGVVIDEDVSLPMIPTLTGKNLTLRSGAVNPQTYYPELMALIQQGRIKPEEIITHRMPLEEGARGYEIFDAHEEDVLKVVLET